MFANAQPQYFCQGQSSLACCFSALSFLLLIGVLLTAEGFGQHVEKGAIYFAMGFALAVEMVNYRADRKAGRSGETAP